VSSVCRFFNFNFIIVDSVLHCFFCTFQFKLCNSDYVFIVMFFIELDFTSLCDLGRSYFDLMILRSQLVLSTLFLVKLKSP
jgi:hypothetical protein